MCLTAPVTGWDRGADWTGGGSLTEAVRTFPVHAAQSGLVLDPSGRTSTARGSRRTWRCSRRWRSAADDLRLKTWGCNDPALPHPFEAGRRAGDRSRRCHRQIPARGQKVDFASNGCGRRTLRSRLGLSTPQSAAGARRKRPAAGSDRWWRAE
jgi:hypothetical protein